MQIRIIEAFVYFFDADYYCTVVTPRGLYYFPHAHSGSYLRSKAGDPSKWIIILKGGNSRKPDTERLSAVRVAQKILQRRMKGLDYYCTIDIGQKTSSCIFFS